MTQVEWLVVDGPTFALSSYIYELADAERASFAGQVGAGITDLYMNALGYTWRDNAACLAASLDPHADFIYGGGPVSAHGVVLAEARGSFAAKVSCAMIGREAKCKYKRQVKPYVAANSRHGRVIHGYSIAFGSRPGKKGAFLNVSETLIPKRRRPATPPTAPAPTSSAQAIPTELALASHRSNFILMGAPSVAAWIDWIRGEDEQPIDTSPIGFLQIPYADRTFLACVDSLWPSDVRLHWLEYFSHELLLQPSLLNPWFRQRRVREDFAEWFVMEEKAAERFLNSLSGMISSEREHIPSELELPSFEPIGFALGQNGSGVSVRESKDDYALYRDGLALLDRPPPQPAIGSRNWHPKEGLDNNHSSSV